MTKTHEVRWIDAGREPQCPPDPAYPNGVDIDFTLNIHAEPISKTSCKVDLPYPAKRCGRYEILCKACRLSVAVTTAGRPDDPRSVTIPCKEPEGPVQ